MDGRGMSMDIGEEAKKIKKGKMGKEKKMS